MLRMGIRRWFQRSSHPAAVRVTVTRDMPGSGEPAKMASTTTTGADAAAALFRAHRQEHGGLLQLRGQLVPEPANLADPNAVAVHVEGERLGYLPGHLAQQLALAAGGALPCQVQLWGAPDKGTLRVVGWVAPGDGPVAWPHTVQNPPPVTIEQRRQAQAAATTRMVDEALGGDDPRRREEFRRGMVGRTTTWKPSSPSSS
jgi:hypothetical protein